MPPWREATSLHGRLLWTRRNCATIFAGRYFTFHFMDLFLMPLFSTFGTQKIIYYKTS
jgi:hypothetical protein